MTTTETNAITAHCCECLACIDEAEAAGLREHLTVLTRAVHDGYNNAEVGRTPLERIGMAVERIRGFTNKDNAYLLTALKLLEAELKDRADTIPICKAPGLCEKHAKE